MNEFIKERFSYLADNKKENVPELNVSYGIDKNFLYGAGAVSYTHLTLPTKRIV